MVSRWTSGAQLRALLGSVPFATPVYRDLADRIRMLIVDGRLPHEVRVPSERDLSEALRLSRTTVAGAYTDLRERGYLVSRRGAGNFISLPYTRESSSLLPVADDRDAVTIGLTTASSTAPAGLADAYARAMERLPAILAGSGYLPDGSRELRERVAESFERRGLPTDPEQIVITSGALSAINIVARCLLGTGERVVLESPTYVNAIEALRSCGARLVGFSVTETSWDVAAFETALRQAQPRLAYLIPDFHNPTGFCLDDDTRAAAAAALQRHGTTALVDETLTDLPLDGQSMPLPLASHLPDAVTVGSASKSFWGGLRTGWIRAPRNLVRALIETRAGLDLSGAPMEQAVTADLLADPTDLWSQRRAQLAEKRDHLMAELARVLPDWRTTHPRGGLSLWVTLPTESSTRLVALAEDHGLALSPGPAWHVEPAGERHLRLPFTAPTDVLSEAVARLARAYEQTVRLTGTERPTRVQLSA